MMPYDEIRKLPTSLYKADYDRAPSGIHESCLRAYMILQRVKYLLAHNVHPSITLELITMMEDELE